MNDENVLCLLRDVIGEKCFVVNCNLVCVCFFVFDLSCIFVLIFDWLIC